MTEPAKPKGKPGRPWPEPGKTDAERQSKSAAALKEAGGFRQGINFSPDAALALDALIEHKGYKNKNEAVNQTLIEAASKIKR